MRRGVYMIPLACSSWLEGRKSAILCFLEAIIGMPYKLITENLGKRFGRRILFRDLSFMLEEGQILAVTGANGSGKSTLLRILAGVMSPTRGMVRLSVGGKDFEGVERAMHIGLVAPYLNVYDGFTARENMQFLAKARRLPHPQERIDTMIALVALTDRADDYVRTYSSGMKQRVKYAAALLAEPPLLLLDEPSSNLDTSGIEMVEKIIRHQRETGRLVVIATNDPQEAASCERQVRIEDYP